MRGTMRDFDMFTEEGNAAVKAICDDIIAKMRSGELRRVQLEEAIRQGCKTVSAMPRQPGEKTTWGEPPGQKTYGEVYDTEPQYAIADYISAECEAQGWQRVSRWDW